MTSGASTPIIAIVGATATGKTALSVDLANRIDGEIINADAMQFYRGMDIGTAKATVEERGGVPHHLIDVFDLPQEASVAEFQTTARHLISQIRGRGKTPILVGGSGLYVRAVLDRIEFPPTDPTVREKWEQHLETHGLNSTLATLKERDPVSADRLGDARRIVRALEVHELTGRPFSSFMPEREYVDPNTRQIGLSIDRPVLHERISLRVQNMIDQGLAEEVTRLLPQGLQTAPTASRAIGYPQTIKYLHGEIDRQQWAEKIATATRQFARRQDTWFKADPRVVWFPYNSERLVEEVLSCLHAN